MAEITQAGSITEARSTNQTPSSNARSVSPATSIASRVLPVPPGPVSVKRRAPFNNRRLISAIWACRPMKRVS
jgi:hypothetical protein